MKLETYPGYIIKEIDSNDLDNSDMIQCEICGFVVNEDEYLTCETCGVHMCLYCWQGDTCPEHGQVSYNDTVIHT
ncbi:MAG: hypothetical protein ABH827_05045, partial [bacterium]